MFVYLADENAKRAVSLALLGVGMLIFTMTVLAHVEAMAQKAEAELKLVYASMSWEDQMYTKYKNMMLGSKGVLKK